MSNSLPISGNGTNLQVSRATPVVDFTSADFDSINQDLTTYAQATFSDRWTDFNADQWAVVFKELIAYVGDLLSYQVNSTIRELYAATVIRRQNLINIGKTYDYVPAGEIPATGSLVLTLNPTPVGGYPITIERTERYSNGLSGASLVAMHPSTDTTVLSYPVGGTVTVDATEGQYFENVLIGVSNGAPNQRWQFPQQNVVNDVTLTIKVGASTWTISVNLILNQSTDTVLKIIQTDDGYTYASFGDGVFGAIPPNGQQITANFNVSSIGSGGNVPANTIQNKLSANPAVTAVNNPLPFSNGAPVQSMKSARQGIPATLSTLNRGVTATDYANLAELIAGVAQARAAAGTPPGSRTIAIWIAPNGGGPPSDQLLFTVSTMLQSQKMVTNRIRTYGPFYKNLRLNVLLHVNNAFRASDVEQLVQTGIINPDLTGILDFPQLDFGGVFIDADGTEELLVSQTNMQAFFNSLSTSGLDRAEIQQLDVETVPRTPLTGNTGNGTVSNITTNGRQRRRQYVAQAISSAQYVVYERIVGTVTGLSSSVLTDANEIFDNEGISSYAGYLLIPDSSQPSTTIPVLSASGSNVTVNSNTSLFALTEANDTYYLYNPNVTPYTIGQPYTSTDGAVTFTMEAGTDAFVGGDYLYVDVYPLVSDLILGTDEYPVLTSGNLTLRTSGGSSV